MTSTEPVRRLLDIYRELLDIGANHADPAQRQRAELVARGVRVSLECFGHEDQAAVVESASGLANGGLTSEPSATEEFFRRLLGR